MSDTPTPKLSKKQLKALAFKAKNSEKAAKQLEEVKVQKREEEELKAQQKPKKRKTRRGHHGKGKPSLRSGPRFILFVGNLPYDVNEKELKEHFKVGKPDVIRIRKDKGIAFMEFLTGNGHIQGRIDACLALHHSVMKNRKINVELTAGGGGNSQNRLGKIKTKNEKLLKERVEKIKKSKTKPAEKVSEEDESSTTATLEETGGIHPSRLALIEHGKH
ncbi:DEKNAAC105569 [Brettanomyces naardenensis]|uniref:DEKNAAC105569 n=1 Tax=Brettanomyces naardenensis TaxID=13370 RepID=A0A448YTX6_BRENA|nr:DEKNAAC105569 [Brettanomyces naardenensis]